MSGTASDAAAGSDMGSASESASVASQKANVEERLESLHQLDQQITEILDRGSAVVQAIASGKQQTRPSSTAEERRGHFKDVLESYNALVEEVNRRLRVEVKMLHNASHSQLLPLNIAVQASEFGREKEDAIFRSLEKGPNQDP